MADTNQKAGTGNSRRDLPGIVLGLSTLMFGLALYVVIPFQVSVEPIPGASQFVAFTPADLPRACATAFVLLGLVQLFQSMRQGKPPESDARISFTWNAAQDFLVLGLAIILYPEVMLILGYPVATIFFLLLLILYGGERRLAVLVTCAVGVPLAIYVLFVRLMSIPLPAGWLFE